MFDIVGTVKKVFDYLLPPAAVVKTVETLEVGHLNELYEPRMFERTHYLLSYSDAGVQAMVKAAKFYRHQEAARRLALQFDRWLKSQSNTFLILPIPLSTDRQQERGHNQVTTILSYTKLQSLGHRLDTTSLKRIRHTKPQTKLTKAERMENLTDAFAATENSPLTGKHLLLVDDVTTTGATLDAAEAALALRSPASITRFAFAH